MVGAFSELKKGYGDGVGAFSELKKGYGDGVGGFDESKRAAEMSLRPSASRKWPQSCGWGVHRVILA